MDSGSLFKELIKLDRKPTNIPGKAPPKAATRMLPTLSTYSGSLSLMTRLESSKFNSSPATQSKPIRLEKICCRSVRTVLVFIACHFPRLRDTASYG